jgi:hypothetical protein
VLARCQVNRSRVGNRPQFSGLEPTSESSALLVESEWDNGSRHFGEDFLDDLVGVLRRKSAAPWKFEKKGAVQTIEFDPARRVRQIADLALGGIHGSGAGS